MEYSQQISTSEGDESTTSINELSSHLETNYNIKVSKISPLDVNVFRIEKIPAPSWVARLFPSESMQAERSAKMLSFLRQAGFSAEKCAHKKPITNFRDQKVLVTGYLWGSQPKICTETFRRLGDLLGRLHTLPVDEGTAVSWKGGAWHHLCAHGGPHEEITAVIALLDQAKSRIPTQEHAACEELRKELVSLDDFEGLSQSVIHPDFVPVNVVETLDGNLLPIDWTGSGMGPRVFSLAWLLFAAATGGMKLVEAVIDGYTSHMNMSNDELSHILNSILTRQLSLACWEVCNKGKKASAIVEKLPAMRTFAAEITQVATAFQGGGQQIQIETNTDGNATSNTPLQEVGTTSLFTAAVRAEETNRANWLFKDPLAQDFISNFKYELPKPRTSERADTLRMFIVARTVFYDDLILSAMSGGCTQVVLLGAGMDTRAFRLPLREEIIVFELDTPDLLDRKNNILKEAKASPVCARSAVPCDLCTDWTAVLLGTGFNSSESTVWIIEGVFVYLEEEIVNNIIEAITAMSPAGSRMGLDMASHDQGASIPWRLRRSTAPLDPVAWLAEHGWKAEVSYTRDVLRNKGRLAREIPTEKIPKPKALLIDAVRMF